MRVIESRSECLRPLWAEVDLSAVAYNLNLVRQMVGPEVQIMAIVKANGYGHGSVEASKKLLSSGANWLGVASPEEGIVLRQAGIIAPILVLGAFIPGQEEMLLKYNLTPTVCHEEAAQVLSQAAQLFARKIALHVKVDTGMGRLGFLPEQVVPVLKRIKEYPGVVVQGLFSHLSSADEEDRSHTRLQIERFKQLAAKLREVHLLPQLLHMANSAGILKYPEAYFNMVRPGVMLYGMSPLAAPLPNRIKLRPVLTWKATVNSVKRVPANTGVSYGQTYHTKRETTLAVIPVGYADGYSRLLTDKAEVLLKGWRCPVVGRICMDQCVIDVGDLPVQIGDEVTIIGRDGNHEILAAELAEKMGTINYEITCAISERVPRIYKGKME
ncbi:MAG: alanine racemase [Bacillota bacterium]